MKNVVSFLISTYDHWVLDRLLTKLDAFFAKNVLTESVKNVLKHNFAFAEGRDAEFHASQNEMKKGTSMDPSPTSEIDVLQVLAKLHDSCEAAGRQNPGSQHRCQGDPPHRRLAFLLRVRQAVRANCELPRGSPLAIRLDNY